MTQANAYSTLPHLYSFRRCPYAIRARMALRVSETRCVLREVVLKDKPQHMLDLSPKGTVPVLVLADGRVIDESLDIMFWALQNHDPEDWMAPFGDTHEEVTALIGCNDGDFKHHLDRYKYANRYPGTESLAHRSAAENHLMALEERLSANTFLCGERPTLADFAIGPFIRQFANADRAWFDQTDHPHVIAGSHGF